MDLAQLADFARDEAQGRGVDYADVRSVRSESESIDVRDVARLIGVLEPRGLHLTPGVEIEERRLATTRCDGQHIEYPLLEDLDIVFGVQLPEDRAGACRHHAKTFVEALTGSRRRAFDPDRFHRGECIVIAMQALTSGRGIGAPGGIAG